MPTDDPNSSKRNENIRDAPNQASVSATKSSVFAIPPPLKRLFDRFPLVTYPPNSLPLRSPRDRHRHKLYVWAHEIYGQDASLSFNPACLKWQAYLRICGIEFDIVNSNNHASPSGALPFLVPASHSLSESTSSTEEPVLPITSDKLQRWALDCEPNAPEESADVRYEAYLSLVDHSIRRAWLYSLYLTPNFEALIVPAYTPRSSYSSSLVRLAIAYELQSAAQSELKKHSVTLDSEQIYKDAQQAFHALETLLAVSETGWFFGSKGAALFDAAVFAFTHLILDNWEPSSRGDARLPADGAWKDDELRTRLKGCPRLEQHRNRILQDYMEKMVTKKDRVEV